MKKIGLALSGGGYRAAAFHLGTLRKLNELKILDKVDVFSTISGGSITGAYYVLNKSNFNDFDKSLYDKLIKKDVIKNVLFSYIGIIIILIFISIIACLWLIILKNHGLIGSSILFLILIFVFSFQFYLLPISKRIETIYDNFFFKNKTLNDLPESPIIAIGSTNLQTFRPFTFSRNKMGDSTYSYGKDKIQFNPVGFPVSRAVMASSCVPFAFSPIKIAKIFYTDVNKSNLVHPLLVDGGLYDNQGIHKLTQLNSEYYCDTIIVSDAGGGDNKEVRLNNTFAVLNYTMESFMYRIKMQQMIDGVYKNVEKVNREITYCPLMWDIENCIQGFMSGIEKNQIPIQTLKDHELQEDWIKTPKIFEKEILTKLKDNIDYDKIYKPTDIEKKCARAVGTNLTKLTKDQINSLISQASSITEIQTKLYCPSLFKFSK